MPATQISTGQLLAYLFLAFVGMAAYPFAKAALLDRAMGIVKFQSRSYWKAFFCVLIAAGAATLFNGLLVRLAMGDDLVLDPTKTTQFGLLSVFVVIAVIPTAELVAVLLFFKESFGRSLGALALHWVFFVIASVVIGVAILGFVFIVKLVAG